MRKIVLTVVATCAVVAFIPASAVAHGHGERHHHRGHHARIHHRQFGHDWGQSGNTTSADQNAGTVQSFTNGVLTIALTGGQTVSGQVTPGTEIECRAPETSGMQSHDRGDGGDRGDDHGDNNDQDNNDQDDNDQDEINEHQNCDMSALTLGTVVHEARLRLSGAGATWDKVELVSSSTSSSSSSGDH